MPSRRPENSTLASSGCSIRRHVMVNKGEFERRKHSHERRCPGVVSPLIKHTLDRDLHGTSSPMNVSGSNELINSRQAEKGYTNICEATAWLTCVYINTN
ncbi:hypothetical protein E2C01_044557 [Portunus trituberculatus]|uniref:Uncharacterized protein n=1 Tax=Portunus trituberculatus TaxID=210409 RepID=A0A5B7FZH7_PORTR|nr:hypothetical protein [Portunus trituberculatus]